MEIDVAVRMRGIALLCTRRVAYKLLHILACNFCFYSIAFNRKYPNLG